MHQRWGSGLVWLVVRRDVGVHGRRGGRPSRTSFVAAILTLFSLRDAGAVTIATSGLPNGVEMVPYSFALEATNGTTPYSWGASQRVAAWGFNNYYQTDVPGELSNVVRVAAGEYHSLALKADGRVVAWGYKGWGQTNVPPELSNAVDIAAGFHHSLALRSDNTVVAWGRNTEGQTNVPPGLNSVVRISAGADHSLALCADGRVVAWGAGAYGQTNVPAGLSNVVGTAAGGYHSLAVLADGRVAAWGRNTEGQTNVPAELSNVVKVAAGAMHSLALCADGHVVAWGYSGYGQTNVPAGLSGVVDIAGGENHSLALCSDGTVVAWGYNGNGQTSVPAGLSNVVAIAAGGYHSLAVRMPDVLLPVGLSLSKTGLLAGTPLLAATSLVTFVVQDADNSTTNRVLSLVIAPNPNARPTLSSNFPPTGAFGMGEAMTQKFEVWGQDPEGSNITYSWTWDGASVGGSEGAYTHTTIWGDAGEHTLRCYVSDDLWANHVYAQWDVAVLTDYDGDGMPDQWEVGYFGDRSRDATGDYDGDGVPDKEEYVDGCDPTVDPTATMLKIVTASLPNAMEMMPYLGSLEATNGWPPYAWRASSCHVEAWGNHLNGQTNVPSGLSNVVALSAGPTHSLALKSDGKVVAWGSNGWGQTNVPAGLSNVVAVSAGDGYSLALKSDGRIVAWPDPSYAPAGLSNVVAISAGKAHSLALKSDGRVVAWGYSYYGQTNVPVWLSNVVAVSAGGEHSLALTSDGLIVGWGNDGYGQATEPFGLSNVVALSAGRDHSLALKSDGTVVAWGYGYDGQTNVPNGLTDVVAVAAGWSHSLALCSDGTVVAWGDNYFGQSSVPSGLSNAVGIAAGFSHSLVLRASGQGLPLGLSMSGDGLVTGTPVFAGTNPVNFIVHDTGRATASRVLQVVVEPNPNTRPVISSNSPPTGAFSMGEATNQGFRVWAIDPEGSNVTYSWTWDGATVGDSGGVYTHTTAWGDVGMHVLRCDVSDDLWTNAAYVLWNVTVLADFDGDGMPDQWEVGYFGDRSRDGSGDYDRDGVSDLNEYLAGRNPIVGLPEIVTASLPIGMEMVSYSATLQASNGTPVYTWGISLREVLAWGDGAYGQTNVPDGLTDVVAVAAGGYHSLALRSDGTVTAWGYDGFGQTNVPDGLSDVVAVAAGVYHSVALRSNGTVTAWGYGYEGQTNVPDGLSDAVAVAAGGYHSVALRSNGTVTAWGNGYEGQTNVPDGLNNVVAVAAGDYHSLALRSNGTVAAWGYGYDGQTNVPDGLSNVVGVAAGAYHSLALKADGSVVAWGRDGDGQTSVPDGLSNVVAVAAGGDHNLALKADGQVVAWGYNDGQTNVPDGLSNVVAVAAGRSHNLVLRDRQRLPEGLSCSTNGAISGVPTLAGTNLVMFVVVDADGAETNRTLEIVIEPNPNTRPVIVSNAPPIGALSVGEAMSQTFEVWASDPEGSNVTYSWTWDGESVGGSGGAYTHTTDWGDAGLHVLRCYVSDDLWTNASSARWDVMVMADYDADGMPDSWEVGYFGDRSRDGAGDHDGDRLPDFLEYAFNLDPQRQNVPSDFLVVSLATETGVPGDEFLMLRFVRRVVWAGLRYTVAVSEDLVNWDRTETDLEQWCHPEPTGDGVTEWVTYRLRPNVSTSGKRFVRLEVSRLE